MLGSDGRTRRHPVRHSSRPVYRRKDTRALKKRRLFAQWKPPYAEDGRNRRLPCAEDEKQKKERPEERTFFLFLRPEATEGRVRASLGVSLSAYRRKGARLRKRHSRHIWALFPSGLSEKRRSNFSLPPFFLSFPPGTRGGAAKTAPFSRNTQVVRSKNEPFLRNAPASPRSKPFTEPHTKNRMEKNAFRTPPRGLCGGFSFRRCPSVGALPLVAPPYIEEAPSVGNVACLGGFFSQERRMFHVKQASKMAQRLFHA